MKTTIFILSHKNISINKISCPQIRYIGIGNDAFSEDFEVGNKLQNINHKHIYYGDLVGQYYVWKNYILKNIHSDEWVGFGQYRRYFLKKNTFKNNILYNSYSDLIIKKPLLKLHDFACRFNTFSAKHIANLFFQFFKNTLNPKINFKELSKIILKNVNINNDCESILTNPILLNADIKNQYIQSHSYMNHETFNKILELMDENTSKKFTEHLKKKIFSPHNMFISKPWIIDKYFTFLFDLYEKIENNLDNIINKKITKNPRFFSHLAERLTDFWFKTYTKNYTLPIGYLDE